jgi:hypothetical protein
MLAYVKHQWALGNRRDAFARLQSLVGELRYARARRFFVVSRNKRDPTLFFLSFSLFETRGSRRRRGSFLFSLARE